MGEQMIAGAVLILLWLLPQFFLLRLIVCAFLGRKPKPVYGDCMPHISEREGSDEEPNFYKQQ